jgi:tetratricopeptide (TPR) repeat protein
MEDRMKKLTAIAGLLLVASFAAAQTATVLSGPFDEALAKAQKENKLVLVDFFSSGWGGCKLLVQQFYNNPKYADFLNKNVILYRASRGDKIGDTIYERFKINATPTELFVDKNGNEVDWIVGYGPPADKFLEQVKKSVSGVDTYGDLTARYAKDPTNVEVVFKLAQKCASRYSDALTAKSTELYKKILTMDMGGRTASYYDDNLKATVSYVEAAEFHLAQETAFGRKPDPAPLRAFIAKYPESKYIKNAYSYLGYYYSQMASKEDAAAFFEEWTAKFPDSRDALLSYVQRIVKDKDPVDKGLTLAEKLKELAGYPENPDYQEALANLYVLKNDPGKADEEYGKDFIDGYIQNAIFAMTGYANFWLDQDKNLASAEEMADIAAAALAAKKDASSYYFTQIAGLYVRLKKPDKALAVYGPDFAKKNWGDQGVLSSYASFWHRQGTNLDSALEAARHSVELSSDYYNNFTLAQVLFKLKSYDEALKAAEKAVELVKPMTAKYEGFPVQQYESLVKQIKDAIAKGGEVKK